MRLALDVASVRAEPAGVGVYASSLARALARRAPEKLTLIGLREEVRALDDLQPTVRVLPFRTSRTPSNLTDNYHAWLQTAAAADARALGADLVHYTNATAPLRNPVPFVVTVHDLSVLRMPHFHPALRVATLPLMLNAIARARAVIVPSNSVRHELMRGLRVSARRVVAIEHAAADLVVDPATAGATLDRFGLTPERYLLSVGTIEPRKNVVRLVDAFEKLADADSELQLVLVGTPGWRRSAIERRITESPQAHRIVVTGYLPMAEIGALTEGAAAFCYVSLYEGYGMPVVEAMAHGAPVVTSNRSAMPQAAGGAAVLVDPFDVDDICRGIREAMARRAELALAGRARAQARNWDDVAAEHAAVYEWASKQI